jgi:hypothetical protein
VSTAAAEQVSRVDKSQAIYLRSLDDAMPDGHIASQGSKPSSEAGEVVEFTFLDTCEKGSPFASSIPENSPAAVL